LRMITPEHNHFMNDFTSRTSYLFHLAEDDSKNHTVVELAHMSENQFHG